jgi:II/X family phage/plasmid replication protein
LPSYEHWQCARVDITGNYLLPDDVSVKQALRQLALSDGGRRKATNKHRGGDTVYWNPSSDLVKGKAYHKGPQLAMLRRKGKIEISDEIINMSNRLLRLEHTRAARFFRELRKTKRDWFDLTEIDLEKYYMDFFGRIVGGVEVLEMKREELITRIMQANDITEARAMAAFTTYRNIKQDGWEVVKGYVPRSTFARHLKYLRTAGITDSDLHMGNVIQFKPVRIVLAKPVSSWDEIRRAA